MHFRIPDCLFDRSALRIPEDVFEMRILGERHALFNACLVAILARHDGFDFAGHDLMPLLIFKLLIRSINHCRILLRLQVANITFALITFARDDTKVRK